MSYQIEGLPLSTIIEDPRIKLPRFQRKSTWNNVQNFKLCISVFKEFPLGVVIINKDSRASWLLDGRQRRNALKLMRDDPTQIYDWALSFLKFKKNSDEQDIRDIFWRKIDEYLQADKTEDIDPDAAIEDDNESIETTSSFDPIQQQQSLKTLLEIIIMVHQKPPSGYCKWEKTFNFVECFQRLPFTVRVQGKNVIDPVRLRKFIQKCIIDLNLIDVENQFNKEVFIEYLTENYDLHVGKNSKFLSHLNSNFELIKKSFETIMKSDVVFSSCRIGVITLTNASILDAQNIFSLVNDGGTKLKAEELLSAKPFWNIPVDDMSVEMKSHVKNLYKALGVEPDESVVRWDVCAVILNMIDKNNLVFKKYPDDETAISMEKITLGFKLVSTMFMGGMSNRHVSELEKDKIPLNENESRPINWEDDIITLISEINQMIQILSDIEYFKYLMSWNKSIMELVGNAAALEFVAILYKNWKAKKMPIVESGELKSFRRDSVKLIDRLIYEYVSKVWRGSGDSRMASDIKNWQSRIISVESTDWDKLIKDAMKGSIGGSKTTVEVLSPIIYHYNCLRKCSPISQVNTRYEIDHIYPKEMFVNNELVDQKLRDCLGNLSILPKRENISKGSKKLTELVDEFLIEGIEKYAEISKANFKKYSEINNLKVLVSQREKGYLKVFKEVRNTVLASS